MTPEQKKLVTDFLPLAKVMAHRYARRIHATTDISDDIHAASREGLVEAARKFDPERGVHFKVHAEWWIRAAMQVEVRRMRGPVRVPNTNVRLSFVMAGPTPSSQGHVPGNEDEAEQAFWGRILNETPDLDTPLDARRVREKVRELLIAERNHELRVRPSFRAGTPRQADMFLRWASGEMGTEVAQENGMTRSAFDQMVNRMYPAFEKVANRLRNEAA